MNAHAQPVITQPGTGRELAAFGNVLKVMLAGEQTGDSISITMEYTPPGGGPPLHCHSHEDEIFLVIEGRISYLVGGYWTEVGPNGLVYLPKGTAHTYRNIGECSSCHWIITIPSGFEKFFAACAAEFERPSGPDIARIAEIHQEYGIELLEDDLPA